MSGDSISVTVQILDKDFRIACREQELDELLASARYLDQRMREIRDGGRVIGSDRIAIMAALNITHELLQQQGSKDDVVESFGQRIRLLRQKIEQSLTSSCQLEL